MEERRQPLSNNNIRNQTKFTQDSNWWFKFFSGIKDGLIGISILLFGTIELTVVIGDMILVASAGLVELSKLYEYISCHYKRDFELRYPVEDDGEESTVLQLRPIKEATLSVLAFSIGGIIPILAISFVINNQWRIKLVIEVSSVALALSRIGGAFIGRVPIMSTTLRMMIICWGRLIASSHNRNKSAVINVDDIARVKSTKELSGQTCQLCGDEIELATGGEPFVVYNICAFPVCRPCYEFERREHTQNCPQCGTRYKRIKGSRKVIGDDDIDDLDNEFDFGGNNWTDAQHIAEALLSVVPSNLDSSLHNPEITIQIYGQEDVGIPSDQHALIIPPVPFTNSSMTWQRRLMEPGESSCGNYDGDDVDDPNLPRMDERRQPLSNNTRNHTKFTQNSNWWFKLFFRIKDGLIGISILLFGTIALTVVTRDMIVVVSAELVVGAFQAATSEYISCHYKRDFELRYPAEEDREESTVLQLRPIKEATLSVLAFSIGGIILILAVSFVINNQWRIELVIEVSSVALALSRIGGAFIGMVPIMSTTLRMMIICWFTMGVSYVLTTLFT
ncbi:hypothetical protein NE237_033081 [Protea cynaroides]|uniref:Cellulose synthase RING-type zinc finger domain-containing protein n=1 Tax=Protea cynaroides TaxID=273540 RepID=A0A9Q0R419_9MAGN|nr:hypothetical protein NE237_033081 [Protea cynaroides]